MRELTLSVLVSLLFLSPLAAQENDSTAGKAILEKAVKAQGGFNDREIAVVRKYKGSFHNSGSVFTGDGYSDPKNKMKIVHHYEGNMPTKGILVLTGDKGWSSIGGVSKDLDDESVDRVQRSLYVDRVVGLVMPLKEKGFTFKLLGDSTVKDKDVVGIKVLKEGKQDIDLYFDKTNGFLVKSANKRTDLEPNKEVLQEAYYGNYQLIDAGATAKQQLLAAKLKAEGPALVAFLKKHTPSKAERTEIAASIANLGNPAFATRQKASAALVQWGGKAVVPLRQVLNDLDREIVRRAEKTLDAIGQSPESGLLAATLTLLELRRPEGAAEALLEYLPWAMNEQIAKDAMNALAAVAGKNGQPHPAVAKALTDENEVRRNAAKAVLGKDDGVWRNQGWRRIVVDGLILPRSHTTYRDGKINMTLETVELHFYNRLDDGVFARPE